MRMERPRPAPAPRSAARSKIRVPPDLGVRRMSPSPSRNRRPSALRAEILLERLGEGGAPIAFGFQPAGEEAEHGRLFAELQAANHLAVVVEPLQSVRGVLVVRHGENPPGHGEPHQFHVRRNIASFFVAIHGDAAALHAADAGGDINRGRQSAGGVLGLRHARPPAGVTTGTPFSSSRPTKYLMASAEAPATSRSHISRMPTAMASISFEDMPP